MFHKKDGFKFMNRPYGNDSMLIESARLKESIAYIKSHHVESIVLAEVHGYLSDSIEFISELKDILVGIEIWESPIINLSPLHLLENLTYLSLTLDSKKLTVDFGSFPFLKVANIVWGKNFINLEKCRNLVDLNLYDWNEPDCMVLKNLNKLEELNINRSKKLTSLRGIEELTKLSKLDLYHCRKLADLTPLKSRASSLGRLYMQGLKSISDYNSLGYLKNVEQLTLISCAPAANTRFLEQMTNLQYGYITIDIVDGNTDKLVELPVIFKNYPHFTQKNIRVVGEMNGKITAVKKTKKI